MVGGGEEFTTVGGFEEEKLKLEGGGEFKIGRGGEFEMVGGGEEFTMVGGCEGEKLKSEGGREASKL